MDPFIKLLPNGRGPEAMSSGEISLQAENLGGAAAVNVEVRVRDILKKETENER